MSADKSGSPSCGIYVRIDDFSNMLDAIGQVRKLAFAINRASGYEKNLAVIELAYNDDDQERINDLIPIIRGQGLVCLLSGTSKSGEADGIIFSHDQTISEHVLKENEDKIIARNLVGQKNISTHSQIKI